MQLFYTDDILADICRLSAEESKHCVRVLRMGVGSEIMVTDGSGVIGKGRILDADERDCAVEILERQPDPCRRGYSLHMAVAPTKNPARYEWFVEKAVEVGVDVITPIVCDHSERGSVKTDRLRKLALSAMKQSLKATKTIVDDPMSVMELITSAAATQRFIAHCDSETERVPMKEACRPGGSVLVLVGPEGDFSPREIEAAKAHGFQAVTFGNSRLRTETAALYATMLASIIN